jgi:hypothetical protein
MQKETAAQENIDPRNVRANQRAREAETMGPQGQQRMAAVQRNNLDPRNLHASQQAKAMTEESGESSGGKRKDKKEKVEDELLQKKREEFVKKVDYDLARLSTSAAL